MTVGSARDLSDLVATLSSQFSSTHAPAAHALWTQADAHINHVVQEGGRWISNEIRLIEQDWQGHRSAIQEAEQWFEKHVPLLKKIAADAQHLSTEVLRAGGASTAGSKGGRRSVGGFVTEYLPFAGAIGGYAMTAADLFNRAGFVGDGGAVVKVAGRFNAVVSLAEGEDSFYRSGQAWARGDTDLSIREGIDGVWEDASVVPQVALAKTAFDGGYEIGKVIDGDFSNMGGTDHHWVSGPASGAIYAYAQEHGHGDEANRYAGPVGFARFARDTGGADVEGIKDLLHL